MPTSVQPTLTPPPPAGTDAPNRVPATPLSGWREQWRRVLVERGITHDVIAAVLGRHRPHVTQLLAGDPNRALTADHIEKLIADDATHEVAIELMRALLGPGYVISRAPTGAGDLNPAKVISLINRLNNAERALLGWLGDPGPKQLGFVLRDGEMAYEGLGVAMWSARNVKARRRTR